MKTFTDFLKLNEAVYVRGSATLHIDGQGEVYEFQYTIPSAIKGTDVKITQRSIGHQNIEIGNMNAPSKHILSSICEVLTTLGNAQEALGKIKKGMPAADAIKVIENTAKFIGKAKIDKMPALSNDINHVFIEWS